MATPEGSARAKRAWETRRKNAQAKQDLATNTTITTHGPTTTVGPPMTDVHVPTVFGVEPQTAPAVTVSERQAEPQEKMYQGELDEAQKLIDARLGRQVFDHTSQAIRFKDPSLVGMWFNEAISPQQIYKAKMNGWLMATIDMIENTDLLGVFSVNSSNEVVRGQRGEEHLGYMTKENRRRIDQAKTAENDRRIGIKADTADIQGAMASQFGAQAADQIKVVGGVTDSVERMDQSDM